MGEALSTLKQCKHICPICNIEFTGFTHKKYCNESCADKAKLQKMPAYRKVSLANRKAKKKKSKLSNRQQIINETVEAREKGLSYGKLQALKYLQAR